MSTTRVSVKVQSVSVRGVDVDQASLEKSGVKVFQMNSRNDNMILELLQDNEPTVRFVVTYYNTQC